MSANIITEEPKSILRGFLDEIVNEQREFIHTDLEELKSTIYQFLNKSEGLIREQDRKKMWCTTYTEQNLLRLQTYIFNSLLAFEGQGVVGFLKR